MNIKNPIKSDKAAVFLERMEWLALAVIFLMAGTIGHDPWWKHGETYSFGIINHFYQTWTWLVPMNAGTPFMEKPPLFYWTAAMLCHLFNWLLPLPDAARLASIFYMLVSLLFLRKLSRLLFGERPDYTILKKTTLLLFLGTYGLVWYAHALSTDIALMTGTVIALYGMALMICTPTRWLASGWWLGLGIGIAFMSKGFILPGIFCISGFALWIISPSLRTRQTLWATLCAILAASPFLFIWPTLLYQHSAILFLEWFWDNNIGRFFGSSVAKLGAENRPFYFLYIAPVFAFPVFPLACAQAIIVIRNGSWRRNKNMLPLIFSLIGMIVLLSSASGRRIYLLPLIPVFSLLAAPALLRIPSLALTRWNSIVRILFSIMTIGTWLLWWDLLYPPEIRPFTWYAALFGKLLPLDFEVGHSQWIACATAFVVALFWLASFRLKPNTPLNTARIWFSGVALVWCTIFTLLLPWIDETRSYRSVFKQMETFLSKTPYAQDCIASYKLNENIAPMLEHYSQHSVHIENLDHIPCRLLLKDTSIQAPDSFSPNWRVIWKGSRTRPSDIENEQLRLYLHVNTAKK